MPDNIRKMAHDEGIGGLFGLSGMRVLGITSVVPNSRTDKHAKKLRKDDKNPSRNTKGKKTAETKKKMSEGIDIEV